MILPPKWSINMGPGVDLRGLCVGQPPRRLRPPSPPRQRSRGRKGQVGGRVLIYPIFTCSCVCEQPACLSRLRPVGSALPPLGLRIICHVVPSDSLQLSPPTLLTRAPLSFIGLWLLNLEWDIPPSPPPSLRGSKTEHRLSNRPRCPSTTSHRTATPKRPCLPPEVAGDLQ